MGLFGSSRGRRAAGPKGHRAYVVGDIHGRLDLLDQLLAGIEADLAERPARKATLVFVGDLIDRGPHSNQVIERLRIYRKRGLSTVFLIGNHEEVLLRILGGDSSLIANWCKFGGIECMASYGADPRAFAAMEPEDALAEVRRRVPKVHEQFLLSFADTARFGDYLIVHAGIRPGVELESQTQDDLRWIREPFLSHGGDHGVTVVHGHTIVREVEDTGNRIAIDTGAYRSGRLTALVIDGDERRYLTASDGVHV